MKLSLVIALMNEEQNIAPLLEQIRKAMNAFDYEVVLVDDGSSDNTVAEIRKHADERTKLIVFQKNYGQTQALSAGIDAATGDYIVTLDGDLQNDPTDIPAMLEKLESGGWDLVAGKRKNRKDGFILRKIPSKIANAIIRMLTGVYIADYGCSLKIFRADIAKNLGLYGELHRFIPVLAKLQGARITEMDVNHHPRTAGKSKYGIGRTFKVISDLMLMLFFQKYMQKPMHLFGTIGFLTFLAGVAINIYMLIEKILGHDIWGRPLLLLGITLVLGGIQLVMIGFFAEIQMRTYFESQDKKPYRIKRIYTGKNG
jgi:glycosyltransferase involved in cell wall biosynthesis